MSTDRVINGEVKIRIIEAVKLCMMQARQHYGQNFRDPEITFIHNGKRVAGYAEALSWSVNFNPAFANRYADEFIARTVPHEIAHLLDYKLHPKNFKTRWTIDRSGRMRREGRSVHGPTWKRIMTECFNADPSRCHSWKLDSSTDRRPWKYQCTDCHKTFNLTTKMHNKIRRGSSRICILCRSSIKFIGRHTTGEVETKDAQTGATANRNTRTRSGKTTKVDRTVNFVRLNPQLASGEAIAMLMTELDMTKAGASTYYYKARKILGIS